ncbi:hypothetical protein PI125_g27323 [Phytophthora idaei]|nr:hypothetical protein PI125_g27323 [Phytophthora idaei]
MTHLPQDESERLVMEHPVRFPTWTLVAFGTFGVRYTALSKFQKKFYPMAFIFVRTETA